MIDTDKYEGHTPADQWTTYKMGADKPYHAVRFGQRGLDLELEFGADAQLIADAPLLLAEVKRLRKLEAAVVGSWMRACDHRGPWHKALRYPCVELGYLTLDGHYFELSEEYQNMAKEWIREQNGDEEE